MLGNQAIWMLGEIAENSEGLRPQRDLAAIEQEAAALQIENDAAEIQTMRYGVFAFGCAHRAES
jgi:hypothetical protein